MCARVRLTVLLGIALLWLGAWMPAQAQSTAQGITLSAVPAFNGHFKYGEWLPIWVQVENTGSDLEAQVQVRVTSRTGVIAYAAPASLPSGSRKRIPLYVPPNSFSHELDVQLVEVTEGRRNVLHAQTVEIEPLPNIHYLVGILAPQRGALSLISGVTLPGQVRPITLVDLELAELPERAEGLRSFDLLILNDVDSSILSPAQIRVLEGWVHDGGRLVIGGGVGALAATVALPASLLPVTPQTTEDVDNMAALATFGADPIRVPGPFVVARGDGIEGRILAGDPDLPLIVERTVGNGFVDYVALDLTVAPFDGWSGIVPFWQKLISPGAAYPDWMPTDIAPARMQTEQMSYALSMLPSLDLPSVRSLAILLGIYILVIGPLNYGLLRRWRRLHLAWITIPALTLIFSAGAFGIGYTLRGNDLILNKIALISPSGEEGADVLSFVGLFSPAQQAYAIQVEGDGLLSPTVRNADPWSMGGAGPSAAEMVIVQGTPSRLQGLAVDQWSMQSFSTESHWSDFGRVDASFQFAADALTGEIHNGTPYPLTDAVILWGNYFKRIGDLPAGATIPFTVALGASDGIMNYSLGWRIYQTEMESGTGRFPRELEVKRSILDNLSQGSGRLNPINQKMPAAPNPREVTLLAWLPEAPPTVTVAGRTPSQQTTALLHATFPYQWPTSGEIFLPPGLLPGELVETPQEGGFCGVSGSTAIYINRGQAIFDFTVPPEFGQVKVDVLKVSLLSDGGWMQSPGIDLYDWEAERWLELESPQLGVNSLNYEPGMMDDSGRLRVRLRADPGQGGGCLYLDLGLDGSHPGGQS